MSEAPGPAPVIRRFDGDLLALGIASHFVARQPEFGEYPARVLTETLAGQISRRDYCFVCAGPRVTGYAGWAMIDRATADAIKAGGHAARNPALAALAATGDVLWLMTFTALDRVAVRLLRGAVRAAAPGREIFGIRYRDTDRQVRRVTG